MTNTRVGHSCPSCNIRKEESDDIRFTEKFLETMVRDNTHGGDELQRNVINQILKYQEKTRQIYMLYKRHNQDSSFNLNKYINDLKEKAGKYDTCTAHHHDQHSCATLELQSIEEYKR